jgi:hypothetical protein
VLINCEQVRLCIVHSGRKEDNDCHVFDPVIDAFIVHMPFNAFAADSTLVHIIEYS